MGAEDKGFGFTDVDFNVPVQESSRDVRQVVKNKTLPFEKMMRKKTSGNKSFHKSVLHCGM